MRTMLIVVCLALVFVLTGCAALVSVPLSESRALQQPAAPAQEMPGTERTIRVNGEASVMVEPDEVILTVGY
jgi:uncharacterized protein YggE